MKILFTDLDGTLLNDESKVSEYSLDVLRRMTAAGHKLVLASGRPLPSIMEVKEQAGIDMPGVFITASNGALVYDCDRGVTIHLDPVPMDVVLGIWEMAHEEGLHIQTYTDDHVVTPFDDEEIREYTVRVHLPIIFSDRPQDVLTHAPAKMLALSRHELEKLDDFRKKIIARYGDKIDTKYSEPEYLEIFSKTAGKGAALTWLCDYLGIPIGDSYAAGDAMNDISMIEAAGHGIAMCNSHPGVSDHAEIITKYSNDEDGLAKEIEDRILK